MQCYHNMTQIVLNIENHSAADAIRSLVKNMIGVKIVSDTRKNAITATEQKEEDLTSRICKGLEQVKMIQEGKLPRRTIQDLINEL